MLKLDFLNIKRKIFILINNYLNHKKNHKNKMKNMNKYKKKFKRNISLKIKKILIIYFQKIKNNKKFNKENGYLILGMKL